MNSINWWLTETATATATITATATVTAAASIVMIQRDVESWIRK
jgi:hypothetical protein